MNVSEIEISEADRARITRIYFCMKHRCENPKNPRYNRYGGRGVKVCAEWSTSRAFRDWAVSSGYSAGLGIDRIDSAGDYCPTNCRWATKSQQNTNIRHPLGPSGFRGVHKDNTRWRARIGTSTPGKRGWRWLGSFKSKLQAAFAYDDAAFEIYGEFAVLNFPERIRAKQKLQPTPEPTT